jgi:hypothetical protein
MKPYTQYLVGVFLFIAGLLVGYAHSGPTAPRFVPLNTTSEMFRYMFRVLDTKTGQVCWSGADGDSRNEDKIPLCKDIK